MELNDPSWSEMTEAAIRYRRDRDYLSGGDMAWRYMQAWRDVEFLLATLRRIREGVERFGSYAIAAADCYYGGFQKGCDHRHIVGEALDRLYLLIDTEIGAGEPE